MKLKFKDSDGGIIAVGSMPNLQPGAGETVENYVGFKDLNGNLTLGAIPPRIDYYKRTDPGTLQEKTAQEKQTADNLILRFTKQRFLNFINAVGIPDEALITDLASAKQQIGIIIKRQNRLIKAVAVLAQGVMESDTN